MPYHLDDETVLENGDRLTTLASSQQSSVASNKAEPTSNTHSESAQDPQEQGVTMNYRKRAHHERGESTMLEDREK